MFDLLHWVDGRFCLDNDDKGGGATTTTTSEKSDNKDDDTSKTDDKSKTDGTGTNRENKGEAVVMEVEGKKYVLQDHVDRLVGTARQEGEKRGRSAVEEEAQQKALEEAGNFKKLYDDLKTKYENLEKERDEERLTALRQRIGMKYKLPDKVIARLQGKNEKEIEQDAKDLAAELGTDKQAPSTESGIGSRVRQASNSGGKSGDGTTETDKKPVRPYVFQSQNDVKRW